MIWSLLACAPPVEIEVDPAIVDLGTVDFATEMPAEGYDPQPVSLNNVGKRDVMLAILDPDVVHLCIQGFSTLAPPYDLGLVPSGSAYTFEVAVCGTEAGERDSEVTTEIVVGTDGDPSRISIPVTFIPTRTIDDGTD